MAPSLQRLPSVGTSPLSGSPSSFDRQIAGARVAVQAVQGAPARGLRGQHAPHLGVALGHGGDRFMPAMVLVQRQGRRVGRVDNSEPASGGGAREARLDLSIGHISTVEKTPPSN
jgi:hypothetical protein